MKASSSPASVAESADYMISMMGSADHTETTQTNTSSSHQQQQQQLNIPLNHRVWDCDPDLTRLDLSATTLKSLSADERRDLVEAFAHNRIIETLHLSGQNVLIRDINDGHAALTEDEFVHIVEMAGSLPNLQELFVFRGNCQALTEDLLSKLIKKSSKLKVLMMWGFDEMGGKQGGVNHAASFNLAATLRRHPSLERITLTLPPKMPYACLDVYVMAFAERPTLHCLNIRGQQVSSSSKDGGDDRDREAVISPEALSLLLASTSIDCLYLEGIGLIDDHIDAVYDELCTNETLSLLDLQGNHFTDDVIYTFARILPCNNKLHSLDLSGVVLSEASGKQLAKSMEENSTLKYMELEGTEERYQDEFFVPKGHEDTEWMKALDYQLRLNRAGTAGNRKKFVEALNSVSDHLGCLYNYVRENPKYCDVHAPPDLAV
jgi:hypothetical protein